LDQKHKLARLCETGKTTGDTKIDGLTGGQEALHFGKRHRCHVEAASIRRMER